MRPYKALFITRTRILFQYRAAAFAGFLTQTFFGIIRIMVLTGFYGAADDTIPLTMTQTIAYIWLNQIIFAILPFRIEPEIAAMIRNGNVAYELVRPLNLFTHWYMRAAALRSVPMLLRAVPMIAITVVILPLIGRADWALQLPATAAAGAGAALSVLLAILISAGITVLASFVSLAFLSQDGPVSILFILVWGLSGILVPLPFFPDALKRIFLFLPFRGIMDVPCQIYMGSIPAASISAELALQAFWVLFLILAGRLAANAMTGRITVQGG